MKVPVNKVALAVGLSPQRVMRIIQRLPPFADDDTWAIILHRVRREAYRLRIDEVREARHRRIAEEIVQIKEDMAREEAVQKEMDHV